MSESFAFFNFVAKLHTSKLISSLVLLLIQSNFPIEDCNKLYIDIFLSFTLTILMNLFNGFDLIQYNLNLKSNIEMQWCFFIQ